MPSDQSPPLRNDVGGRGAARDGTTGWAASGRMRANAGEPVPSTVMLRPIASGLPFGFFGLVAAASVVGAQAYGFLPTKAGVAIGLLLLPTVVAQLVGGVTAVLARTVIGASLMVTFSGVWLGTALVYIARPVDGPTSPPSGTSGSAR